MDAGEPRVRRRGFFFHSDTTGEADPGEHENPQGFVVRVRIDRPAVPRRTASAHRAGGRSRTSTSIESATPEIRSGSVTGSRQRAGMSR